MEAVSSAIAQPVTNSVWALVKKHVDYIRYRQNVDELNDCAKKLELEKEKIDHQCDEAVKNGHNIEGKATEWVRKVGEFETQVEKYRNDDGHKKTRLSNCLFPYFRHRLGRLAKKMAVEGKKLIDDCPKSGEIAYRENVTSNDAILSNTDPDLMEFSSRKSIMENIMTKLEDPTVRMIGLYGPGGVGKSTLIKAIADNARYKKLFNVVAISEITANPNLKNIQEDIAYVLGLKLEGEGENVRADYLRRRLKNEKENTLIILDDLWDRLDLNKLGIPLDDDMDDLMKVARIPDEMSDVDRENFEKQDNNGHKGEVLKEEKSLGDYKGCKILLTSRDKNVLAERMAVKSIFWVKELDDTEALTLLQKVAGIPDEMSNSKQEIVKKYCAGLPMAIVTVGRALKDKSESVWEATLDKLKKQELVGAQNSMEISVKMSYDHLENDELKSIFLLCAQMGHQPLIMDLVKYCFGLGILEGVYSLREARDRIYTSIQKLKHSGLVVLDGSSSIHFNMHDMVRDAVLSIAHKEQNVFTLRNGKLDDWSELERCTSISICNSDIIDKLPNVISCPQLKFFQIDSDDPSLKIPESFFNEMKKLRVLILTGIHLESLPPSIKCLSNLRMLCLERCTLDGNLSINLSILDGNLSIIGELKKLRILSFSGSQLKNLPAELGCLDKLQLLDIGNCSIGESLPNFISRLTSLEELYIGKSLMKMLAEGETNQSQISFLLELKHLHQLKVVDLCIPCDAVLPKDLLFDKLNDYKIVIGDLRTLSVGDFRMVNKYEAFRSLALQLKDSINIHSQNAIKLLFKRVENLLLGELNGVENVIYELNLDGFPDLKHLSITNDVSIKYIINSMDLRHPLYVFPNLLSLCLYNVRNLEMICCSPVTDDSLTKLKTIKVHMCAQLRNLFPSYMCKVLASLETIDVSECDSLKEIVGIPVNSDKVEFLKLHSLTLYLLPSFTSFYTIAEDMVPPLFGELVEIPNLANLYLSSINVRRIWSDQSLSSCCFQNLIKLVVKDCNKLRYICSLSVASGLKKLKVLFVSGCRMMEKIFITEGNNTHKVCVFPKLEEIHLSKMSKLTDIWPAELSADSFSSLFSVHIDCCKKLDKIFPSHMEGWFASLHTLKVFNCKSVEVIFEIKDSQQIDTSGGIDTNLQIIHVNSLPDLKQMWSRDPGGILNFKKLQSIEVSSCEKLRNVFPAAVAKDVPKLEHMSVTFSSQMVEIVACEDRSEANIEPLVFPELTYLKLGFLSNFKHFYKGKHPIRCPKLKKLAVVGCEKLKAFPAETSETTDEEEKAVFSAEKVFPNLEFMQIDFDEVQKWLLSNTEKYRMHRLKELTISKKASIEFESLYGFLYRMPNLEKLNFSPGLSGGPSANIAPQERLGTVLQLKELVLSWSGIKDLGFEREPVLQRLELLSLFACLDLSNLGPPSVSLTYLTYLEVKCCNGLRNLMASSTAKSLVQLKTAKVTNCVNVEEIVTNEGNGEGKVMEIVFSKLITLELVGLRCLTCFCSDKNCKFNFPSLEIFIVRDCPTMEIFSECLTIAPKLQNILAVEGEEEAKWQWEGDLNATIKKVFNDKVTFTYTKELNLSNNDYQHEFIQQLWLPNHLGQQNYFLNLKSLTAYKCDSLEHVIPSHLLPCFENLEELHVWECSAARVIFNINEIRPETKPLGIIRLKELYLRDLPKLEHIWDKDPEGIIGLQVLKGMRVKNSDCLKSLFPASVAKDLTSLEVLNITNCRALVEIFSEDEKAAEGATKEFLFPCLTSLVLEELPGLKYFYPGLHKLESEWPVLEKLNAFDCELVKLKCREDHPEEQVVIIEKVIQIPSFKKLKFRIGDILSVTWDRESGQLRFDKLQRFQEESDSAPLYRFLDMLPSIEKLEFVKCSFEEMFSAERPNADYTRILLDLKGLELSDMDNLKSIGLEHSWLQPFPENLQTLQITSCSGLENYLVPHRVSFSNLTCLEVSDCWRLQYLFTLSTAKSLARLKRMKIEFCENLEEIVSKEDGDEQIIFKQLEVLYLEELDQLRCFYSGNCTLRFSSLEQVYVINCSRMITFSPHNTIDHSIKWFSAEDATPKQECDLSRMFEEKFWESACSVSDLSLRDSLLQEIWHCSRTIPDSCFSNLNSLTVDGCQFLSDAVLPFYLLPFFTKLESLEVRNCDYVKTIFDVKRITKDRIITSPLKELTLWKLPNLENVWNEDPHGILSMQLPEDNADPEGTNLELTFPSLTSLTLWDLPKFKYNSICFIHDATTFELTPNLQHLTLGENELKMILDGEFQGNYLKKLKVLTLRFHIECDLFPYGFLQQVPNIEKLVVCSGSFKEIFCLQSPIVDDTGFLSQLKVLLLESLPELISIGLENSWIEPFLRNIDTLEVSSCNSLQYLFTSSTAKSLVQLKKMKIIGCKSIEEIVSKEGDESNEDEIIFPQLNCLNLEDLPKLRSFYKGSLSFPSLDQLSVIGCDRMETLCPGTVKANKLLGVKLKSYPYIATPLEIDLNFTMWNAFLARFSESADLTLKDSPVLQEIWHGSLLIPDSCFRKLHSLIVEGCQFLSDAVLPFNLLPFLTKLETLEVRNCDSVKTIFDVKCITQDMEMTTIGPARTPLPYALKKLILERLPNLENVWNADPKGTNLELTFPRVKSLTLCDLPKFKNFWQCDMLKEPHTENQVCIEKLTPNLEHLTLGENELKMILRGEFQGNHLHKLKVLGLFFHVESDVFLQQVQVLIIEKLVVCDGSFKEAFCFDSHNVNEAELLSQLKELCMDCLPELVSNGSENSWIVPFLRNLETLEVISCFSSINLVSFTVSFSNLTYLEVERCNSLLYLFRSSTAKSLAQLKRMEIKSSDSIEEIVSKDGDESNEDEIIFPQLNCLNLEVLPKLKSFYKGSLSFPSLEELSAIDCERMETFCAGTVKADKLLGVKFYRFGNAIPLENDLNSAIMDRHFWQGQTPIQFEEIDGKVS